MYRKYRGIPRPKNVEGTIKNYHKTNDKNKRERLYEYILLERKLAETGKIF